MSMDFPDEKLPILRSKSCRRSFSDVSDCAPKDGNTDGIKAYRWRWVVLSVILANMIVNNGIWIAFAPIADVVKCYYGISHFWVNSVSAVYMLTYILFIVPSVWLLDRVGLRTTAVIGACLNATGACLKVAGVGETLHCTRMHEVSRKKRKSRNHVFF